MNGEEDIGMYVHIDVLPSKAVTGAAADAGMGHVAIRVDILGVFSEKDSVARLTAAVVAFSELVGGNRHRGKKVREEDDGQSDGEKGGKKYHRFKVRCGGRIAK